MFVHVGENVKAHHTVRTYGRNSVGEHSIICDNVILGFPSTDLMLNLRQVDLNLEHADYEGCTIGRTTPNCLPCSDSPARTPHGSTRNSTRRKE